MGVFVLLKEEEKEDRLNSHGDLINSRKKMGATFAKQYESPFFQPFQQRKALWGSKTPLASRMGRISPRNGIDSILETGFCIPDSQLKNVSKKRVRNIAQSTVLEICQKCII